MRWFARRRGVRGLDPAAVLPTVGSKELVAFLPALLGLGAGDVVLHPRAAYPTYDVGARLAGATPEPTDDPAGRLAGGADVRLVWLNSPGNPDGSVLGVEQLRAVVEAPAARSRRHSPWSSRPTSATPSWRGTSRGRRAGCRASSTRGSRAATSPGCSAVYSLSKQSNLAGYRAAFVAGDPALVARLLEIRKHAGMIVPAPVQAAMAVALDDDEHVAEQRERLRRRRRTVLRAALEGAGYVVDRSHAGLYLWTRPAYGGQDSWATVADLAEPRHPRRARRVLRRRASTCGSR